MSRSPRLVAAVCTPVLLSMLVSACGSGSAAPEVASLPSKGASGAATDGAAAASGGSGSAGRGHASDVPTIDNDAESRPTFRVDDTEARRKQVWNAYNSCLLEHGAAEPTSGVAPALGDVMVDYRSVPRKALEACAALEPVQPPELASATNPHFREQTLAYVQCMQDRGLWVTLLDDATTGAMAAAVVVLLTAGAVGGLALRSQGDQPDRSDADADRPTVAVVRGDLRSTQQVTGDLGHGRPHSVTGHGGGIITWLPSGRLEVERGEQLYRVDDAPVMLLYGDLPLYHTLELPPEPKLPQKGSTDGTTDGTTDTGTDGTTDGTTETDVPVRRPPLTGHDVDLVAANLAALGLWSGPTEGASYDADLAAAVEAWRGSAVLHPGDAVVTPGPVRVESVTAQVGAEDTGDVLTLTETPGAHPRRTHRTGGPAGQGRPRDRAAGRRQQGQASIAGIGGKSSEGDDGGPPTTAVEVDPARADALTDAPLGPVAADVVTAARDDVLHVPITALVALAEGGYALERPNGALVSVDLGLVAGGQAEIRGVKVGQRFVVAQ